MRHAAFLRGINLGSHRKVAMSDLRRMMEEAGLEDVATYLRSGNVVFTAQEVDQSRLRQTIQESIASELGMEVPVVVVTQPQLEAVIEGCPYPEAAAADPTKVHATFLDPMPPGSVWPSVDADAPESFYVGEGVVYMHLPNGMGRARLPGELERAAADVTATTRNWRTVVEVAVRLEGE
jgi:uncharacterized protein (DUF1697 family)